MLKKYYFNIFFKKNHFEKQRQENMVEVVF